MAGAFPWLTAKGNRAMGGQKYVAPAPKPAAKQQSRPSAPSGPNIAQAQAENAAREKQRLDALAAEEKKKIEQKRFEDVSKAEGEKRRKELEEKSGAAASAATGGQLFLRKEDKKTGTAKLSQPATVRTVAPPSAQGTILGLPKDTKVFTKFGESINRAANLTFSAPETRFGGM